MITLTEHDLGTVGVGSTKHQAETAACTHFLALAQEKNIDAPPTCSLNSSIMSDFLNFWEHRNGVLASSAKVQLWKGRCTYFGQAKLAGTPIGQVVTMNTKLNAEQVAILTAIVSLGQRNPNLVPNFEAVLAVKGRILGNVDPIPVWLSHEIVATLKSSQNLEQRGPHHPVVPSAAASTYNAPVQTRPVRDTTVRA